VKALLVRVGIDQKFGGWNAPVDADGRFVYVPIPEPPATRFHPGLERRYNEVLPALHRFWRDRGRQPDEFRFPATLHDQPIHLDPDFDGLTYGDVGGRRGAGMVGMTAGDVLAFYAGLRPIHPCEHTLLYALIGLYVVREVVPAVEVPRHRCCENAHTRRAKPGETDIVVRAEPGASGRCDRCIPIGEWRDGSYRVRPDVLEAWGGLSVKDGYIQRSAVPPSFTWPEQFRQWFRAQGVQLIARNN
jgi:hypothetical protein